MKIEYPEDLKDLSIEEIRMLSKKIDQNRKRMDELFMCYLPNEELTDLFLDAVEEKLFEATALTPLIACRKGTCRGNCSKGPCPLHLAQGLQFQLAFIYGTLYYNFTWDDNHRAGDGDFHYDMSYVTTAAQTGVMCDYYLEHVEKDAEEKHSALFYASDKELTIPDAAGYFYGWKSPEHRITAIWYDALRRLSNECSMAKNAHEPTNPKRLFVLEIIQAIVYQKTLEEKPDYPDTAYGIFDPHFV